MLIAADVPQTSPKHICAVIRTVAGGADSADTIAATAHLAHRQVNYALAAARTLGLLSFGGGQAPLRLTEMGQSLAATRPESREQRQVLIEAIERSPTMQKIAPGLLHHEPPSREEIAENIHRLTSLSRSTAETRASRIHRWRNALLGDGDQLTLFRGGMWRRIELKNYRSIEKVVVDLAPFTVIVGPNGSGKSNFADALVFAHEVSINAATAIESRGGIIGVRRWRPTKPTDVTVDIRAATSQAALDRDYVRHRFCIHSGAGGNWTFKDELIEIVVDGRHKVDLTRHRDTLKSTHGERLPQVNATASAMVLAGQLRAFARTSALRNVRRYRLNPDAMRQPQLSNENARLEETGANIAAAVRRLRDTRQFDDLLMAMSKIVPGLRDIYVEQVGRFLSLKFCQHQSGNDVAEFNATEMSEGALRALGIVVATLQMGRDELLIIEEPEVAIHVGAAHLLFDILKEASERGAVLITTHSADLLDAARDEEILVCEYKDGTTNIGPLATEQRAVVREGLFSVAELMRSEPLRIEKTRKPRPRKRRQ